MPGRIITVRRIGIASRASTFECNCAVTERHEKHGGHDRRASAAGSRDDHDREDGRREPRDERNVTQLTDGDAEAAHCCSGQALNFRARKKIESGRRRPTPQARRRSARRAGRAIAARMNVATTSADATLTTALFVEHRESAHGSSVIGVDIRIPVVQAGEFPPGYERGVIGVRRRRRRHEGLQCAVERLQQRASHASSVAG